MGVATEPAAGLEQRDVPFSSKRVGCGEAGNARADDGDLHAWPHDRTAGNKNAAKRPGTKEGGREEEKSRPGIAAGLTAPGRLRSNNWNTGGIRPAR